MNKMRHRIFHILLCFAALVLMTGCRHDPELVPVIFTATLEQPSSDDGSKIYLDNERWIYWEVGDEISIAGDNSSEAATGRLINASFDEGQFNGVFTTTLEDAATYFLGLHPMDSRNVIAGLHAGQADFTAKIYLPDTQTRRTDQRGDLTFDKQVYPMVGWYGNTSGDTANLDFHALAGIVRLNLFNLSGYQKTLKQIEITSEDNRQLKGLFNVNDYKIEDPYLTPLENTTVNQTVILYCGESGLPFSASYLHTFYLVLPALHGRGDTANYYLSMKVIATDNTYMIKKFRVPVRRTGLTNMQAMGITDWSDGSDASDNGAGTPGLSGCGTESRPFKVYNINDLTYMRDCNNVNGGTGNRYINGQLITPDTYITLMRSDIELTSSNWQVGIKNFVGHFNTVSNMSNPGIIDNCQNVPLFESIGDYGVVDGITLKSAVTFNTQGAVSPFCTTNHGTLRDCVLTTIPGSPQKNISMFADFGGICVTNTGTIEGCRFQGKVELGYGHNFAGICLENSGTVKGCQLTSVTLTLDASGSTAAGICYSNLTDGKVLDSYFAADVTNSSIDWAGIVYENSGTVEHCYFSATGHIYTSKDAAGIVMNNTDGKVDYCWVAGQLRGINVSGIVQNLTDGKVINCFNSHNAMITLTAANSVGGGLVGSMSGGSIENSYVYDIYMTRLVMSAVMGGIVGNCTSGTINNCYDYEGNRLLYGNLGTTATVNHCYIVDGTQYSVTSVSVALATAATGTVGCLLDNLNDATSGAPSINGAKRWQQTPAGTPPSLVTYVVQGS